MRVTIITGGGSGIGAAVARSLAGPDRNLLLHGQGADAAARQRLEAVASACREAGADVTTRTGDLAIEGAAAALVADARSGHGAVDSIVHAAGFADRSAYATLPRAALERAFAVMAAAFHELTAAALPDLVRTPHARVVAISSFGAHRFAPGGTFPASAAAKAALEVLVKSLAIELAPTLGTANIVVPGFTRKDAGLTGSLDAEAWRRVASANPLQRLADPAEVAAAVTFLLSPGASHVTGATLPVDGGLALL